jgi:hypothetical protein
MAPPFRRLLRSRWSAWLIAWALCLPVAQWATAAHGLLHARALAGEEREAPAKLPVACDLCVVAATIAAAAPGQAPPALHTLASVRAQPAPPRIAAPSLPFLASYRSRAPPFLHA